METAVISFYDSGAVTAFFSSVPPKLNDCQTSEWLSSPILRLSFEIKRSDIPRVSRGYFTACCAWLANDSKTSGSSNQLKYAITRFFGSDCRERNDRRLIGTRITFVSKRFPLALILFGENLPDINTEDCSTAVATDYAGARNLQDVTLVNSERQTTRCQASASSI